MDPDLLAAYFKETPTPCVNCGRVCHVTSEERSRGRWNCYGCGRINRVEKTK